MNRIFAFCKSPFALCILLVLALGALNLKIQYGPVMAENSRHEKAEKAFKAKKQEYIATSAITGIGLKELKKALGKLVPDKRKKNTGWGK